MGDPRRQSKRPPRNTCVVCIVILLSAVSTDSDGAPPVEGDASLLQVVLDAQATNRTRFSKGAISVVVRDRNRFQHFDIQANVRLLWDGTDTYWKYDLVNRDDAGAVRESYNDVEMIERSRDLYIHDPQIKIALKIPDKSREYYSSLKLRPDQAWFVVDRMRTDWLSALSPEKVSKATQRFVVRKEDNRIRVERHMDAGARLTALVSLDQGANVVWFELLPDERAASEPGLFPYVQRGEYEWARDVNGDWYMSAFRSKWYRPGNSDLLDQECELTVTQFEPNPVIAPDRFSFESLRVPDGTRVDTIRDGRPVSTMHVGKEPLQLSTEQLNRLADFARSEGFAAPEREMP